MAEKKVAQEPCIFCGENPCTCGDPITKTKHQKRRE